MAPYDVLVTGSSGHLGTALMLSLPSQGFTPSASTSSPPRQPPTSAPSPTGPSSPPSSPPTPPSRASSTPRPCTSPTSAATPSSPSTTSTFGMALSPKPGSPAAWIDESVVPVPKNIYGVTKVAAEDMCALVQRQTGMPTLVLRTSRFFPEEDDDEDRRAAMADENLKVLELAYRRCDIADIVSAAVCAMSRARNIGWGKYIISAPPPFRNDAETLATLDRDPSGVFRAVPVGDDAAGETINKVFAEKGWKHLARVDRVYDSTKAVRELGWQPEYTFEKTIARLARGEAWRSELTGKVGKKGYHAESTGVYTKR
ncbi:hypothetical protein ACCO45_004641 [Purpureocillium lilacinum]|uniref:Uncharacterized protein n=1 Tax=Purpureocillium lilacinum TaxID=33203 RepID=A0ACC4DT63_PURLI